jgi:hypothetical protein
MERVGQGVAGREGWGCVGWGGGGGRGRHWCSDARCIEGIASSIDICIESQIHFPKTGNKNRAFCLVGSEW